MNYELRNLDTLHSEISRVLHRRTDNIRLQTKAFAGSFVITSRNLSPGSPDYLFDFEVMEVVGYEGCITEDKIRQAVKTAGTDEISRKYGLPYKMYLRLSHMFVSLLVTVHNNWVKQGLIPQRFTRSVVKFLRKSKNGRDEMNNFCTFNDAKR